MSWRRETYGRSQLGAPLEVWMPERERVDTLIVGTIHGDEPESGWMLARVLETIAAGDSHAAIVLAVNPDGLARFTRANANRVDLNRNFPDPAWSNDAVMMFEAGTPLVPELREPQDRVVKWRSGERPGDQPESAALMQLCRDLGMPFLVNVHTPLHRLSWSGPQMGSLAQTLSEMSGLPLVVEEHIEKRTRPEGSLRAWYADQCGKSCLTWEFPYAPLPHLLQTQLAALQLLTHDPARW
jgi:protein MpaA